MRNPKTVIATLCLLGLFAPTGRADVRVASFINNHVVLQRDVPVPIWGVADPGEQVTVAFADRTKTVAAGPFGRWRVELDPMPASTDPRKLTVTGTNPPKTIILENVRVGDVWLVIAPRTSLTAVPEVVEQVKADERNPAGMPVFSWRIAWNPRAADRPQETFFDRPDVRFWEAYRPVLNKYYTGSGYVWAHEWWDAGCRVPLGIGQGIPGAILDMTPPAGFAAVPGLKDVAETVAPWDPGSPAGRKAFTAGLADVARWSKQMHAKLNDERTTFRDVCQPPTLPGPAAENGRPTTYYNDVIHPFSSSAIRGVVLHLPAVGLDDERYTDTMKALIAGLRVVFRDAKLPVCVLQMPVPHHWETREKPDDAVVLLRERQAALAGIENVSVIGTYDLERPRNGDPRDWAGRVARWSRATVTGKGETAGPVYRSSRVEGQTIAVEFDHVGSGLFAATKELARPPAQSAEPLSGFEVADVDRAWHSATAALNGNTVVVRSDDVPKPTGVRYAWSNKPAGVLLYNRDGFPALPFHASVK